MMSGAAGGPHDDVVQLDCLARAVREGARGLVGGDSQTASAPSPQPASNAVPGTSAASSRARCGFGAISFPLCWRVGPLPVGFPVFLVKRLRHHVSACLLSAD